MVRKINLLCVILSMFFFVFAFAQNDPNQAQEEEAAGAADAGNNAQENPDNQNNPPPEEAEPQMPPEPEPSRELSQATNQQPIISTDAADRISLDIKGMDVVDVLKMFASRYGMNIVIGKNVAGRVTLFLKDVDVQDALQIVLLSNDLAYEKKGDIMNIMSQRDFELKYGDRFQDKKRIQVIKLKYAKAADISRALNQIKTNIGRVIIDEPSNTLVVMDTPERLKDIEEFISNADLPIQTRIYSLNYAQADKLSPKMQDVLTKGVGSMRIDERTNKIAVTDYVQKLGEIDRIVGEFDEKSPQVLIDAQIIEVSPNKDWLTTGVNWDYWLKHHVRLMSSMPAPGFGSGSAAVGHSLLFGTAAADEAVTAKGQYKSVIDALRVIGETKVLSSPRIMALNNQEAKILVGTKEAYITSSTSQSTDSSITAQTVNFVDVGIKLYVTPTINKNGFVTMKIKPEVSSAERRDIKAEDKTTTIPIVTTSESETTISVKDGVTIIIAGLKKDQREKEIQKIPILGDIPFIGYFFQNRKDMVTKSELVIFLTPHIIDGEEPVSYQSLTNDKNIAYSLEIAKVEHEHNKQMGIQLEEEYKSAVLTRIKTALHLRTEPLLKGNVEMSFVLGPRGALVGEPVVINSTNSQLNNIAIEDIKKAAPFPSFPKSFMQSQEGFHIILEYK